MIAILARSVVLLLLGNEATSRQEAVEASHAKALSAARCVSSIFKTHHAMKSVQAFAVDDFRVAIEYTFNGKTGRELIGDLVIAAAGDGVSYSVVEEHNEGSDASLEEVRFIEGMNFGPKCHLTSAGDPMLGLSLPRREWHRVNLPSNRH
jgi:hypothetical protein